MFKFFGDLEDNMDYLYVENTVSGEKRFCYRDTKYCVRTSNCTGVEISLADVVEFFQNPSLKEYKWDA